MAPRNRDAKLRRARGETVPKDRSKVKRFRGRNVLGKEITFRPEVDIKAHDFEDVECRVGPKRCKWPECECMPAEPAKTKTIAEPLKEAILSALEQNPGGLSGFMRQMKDKHPAHFARLLEKLLPNHKPMGRGSLNAKIKRTNVGGEVSFDMGSPGDPQVGAKTLYAQLCMDGGEWALVLRPDAWQLGDVIQLTSIPDGGIMVKVVRR